MTLPVDARPAAGCSAAVDVAAGVARLMGNETIYRRALARFLKDYRDAGSAIGAALASGDPALARRLVHTLKGAAGMIEAGKLYDAALALEQVLRAGSDEAAILATRLDGALGQVLCQLDGMRLDEDLPAPREPAGQDALERLRVMLDIGDGAAIGLVESARGALRAQLGSDTYEKLSAAIAQFDYERALELLDRPARAGV